MRSIPKLDKLERVLAVGQEQIVAGTRILVLSLELYDDGFLIRCRAQLGGRDNLSLARVAVVPEPTRLVLQIVDDRGGTYRQWPHSAGGSDMDYAWEIACTPRVDPGARHLAITASAIRLTRHPHAGSSDVATSDIQGPWSFEIPL